MPGLFQIAFLATAWFAQPPEASIQRLVQDGDRALAAGRYVEAEQAYTKLKELTPGIAEVYAKLGVIYYQQGKFPQAAQVLGTALKMKPGLQNLDALLAMSLSEQGRFAEALPNLEKAFRRPVDPPMKRMLGLHLERAYTGTQRDAKAVEVALELNRLYPDDPEILYQSARLLGNFAYLNMRKLSDVAPHSVWRHLASGEVHESQESYTAAVAEYRQVLALDPQRPGIHLRIGRVLLTQAHPSKDGSGDTSEAMKEFEQELRLDPTNGNAAYEIAELHRKDGRFEAARSYFEAALKYYPDFEDALIGLGRTLIALGKPETALPHLQKAITLNPENEAAYYALAQAHLALGNTSARHQALTRFRTLQQKQARPAPRDPRRVATKQEVDPAALQPE